MYQSILSTKKIFLVYFYGHYTNGTDKVFMLPSSTIPPSGHLLTTRVFCLSSVYNYRLISNYTDIHGSPLKSIDYKTGMCTGYFPVICIGYRGCNNYPLTMPVEENPEKIT